MFGTSFDTLKNIVMPLGISFYTFQTLSYTVDVYRGKVKADKNFIRVGAFVTLFPQLIAGPIVLYTDVDKELKSRRLSLMQIQEGVRIFIFGLGKKVLIANNVGALWDEVVRLGFANVSAPLAWLGIIAFSLQIYFDFSGYSQMAIGLGKMLGFNFPDNFNLPYISKSMTEFWRRWHITLGAWFREYLYIPLGGNRCKPARMYFNLFVVWFCTGFWHGASWNFIIWGMFFYVLIVIERATGFKSWLDKSRVVSHIYVVVLLILSWSIFAIEDLGQIGLFWSRLFSFQPGTDALYYLHNYAFSIVVAIICSTPLIVKLYKHIQKHRWLDNLVLMSITVLSVAYLVDASYNPFLYFRF